MYLAEVIVLVDRPVIRIRSVTPRGERFLVGYFASVRRDQRPGGPIELADLLIEWG
jgi:hypothetical protein